MKRVYSIWLLTIATLILLFPCHSLAKTTLQVKMPSSVLNISKDNTYSNETQDLPRLQPSKLAQELLKTSSIKIENPDLIRMLNETSISNAPLAIGYKAKIYLGQWPLHYESTDTTMNWEYKQVNRNVYDNRGVEAVHPLRYKQEIQKTIEGNLTSPIKDSSDVKAMMLLKASEKVQLPLSFKTTIGYGTHHERVYKISPKQMGYLYAYVPAVNEKGKVTFGEVYLVLKGNQKRLVVKNVTSQGIGAAIPIQDYLSFKFIPSPYPQ
ncbi:YfkD family protein [Bacillus cytotoxicus]|uniref:YfkD famly protein n=1 Tax=Bacillus cereus group sp. BfR-BA-01492 TaxID=2920361 RepID=UPI001F57F9B9|nr:YfkD famly protein [Bacillus cereus group sp. BfR-BA-01492]EMA6343650.1 YfkD family protein [Bacillus cytotoxicus]